MTASDYRIEIYPVLLEDGGGYAAVVPDLPGCISDGATQAEALSNLTDAVACWMEAAVELNREIPAPKFSSIRQIA